MATPLLASETGIEDIWLEYCPGLLQICQTGLGQSPGGRAEPRSVRAGAGLKEIWEQVLLGSTDKKKRIENTNLLGLLQIRQPVLGQM